MGPPLSPGTREYVESVLRRKNLIPYKPYVCRKHVESIWGTRKNMTKKVFNLNNTIPHSVRLVNPFQDNLTQYQGSKGHSATSDATKWSRLLLPQTGRTSLTQRCSVWPPWLQDWAVVGQLYTVQYKGIFGAPNQGQMLHLWRGQTIESCLRWWAHHIIRLWGGKSASRTAFA